MNVVYQEARATTDSQAPRVSGDNPASPDPRVHPGRTDSEGRTDNPEHRASADHRDRLVRTSHFDKF